MRIVYLVIAIITLLILHLEENRFNKQRKYAYVSGCFEATSITFAAQANREFDLNEFARIDKLCKLMYPEYLKKQK